MRGVDEDAHGVSLVGQDRHHNAGNIRVIVDEQNPVRSAVVHHLDLSTAECMSRTPGIVADQDTDVQMKC